LHNVAARNEQAPHRKKAKCAKMQKRTRTDSGATEKNCLFSKRWTANEVECLASQIKKWQLET